MCVRVQFVRTLADNNKKYTQTHTTSQKCLCAFRFQTRIFLRWRFFCRFVYMNLYINARDIKSGQRMKSNNEERRKKRELIEIVRAISYGRCGWWRDTFQYPVVFNNESYISFNIKVFALSDRIYKCLR